MYSNYICIRSGMVEELHPPGSKNIKLALLGILYDRVCTFPVWTFTVM
jgi:hypothetical protein